MVPFPGTLVKQNISILYKLLQVTHISWHYFFYIPDRNKFLIIKQKNGMKKLLLTAVVALGTLTAMQAQEKEVKVETNVAIQDPTNAMQEEVVQEDAKLLAKAEATPQAFKEIKVSELPAAVTKAVATDFEGATVQKAYVNEKKEFKLVLATDVEDAKAATKTVFATKEGEWIKKPKAMMKQ